MSTWQPIETAPKDRPILVRWEGTHVSTIWPDFGRMSVGVWRGDHPMPHWTPVDTALMHAIHPTHWMPLPPAPEAP